MTTLEETQSADKARFLNDLALAATLHAHPAILIRPVDFPSWRPCRQSCVGVLEGLEHLGTLVPLCTDGCVAWFQRRLGKIEDRKVPRPVLQEGDYTELVETTVIFGHVADFNWGGEKNGAPPQPHSLPPPQGKAHAITPFQNAKTGKWWFMGKTGKWYGPWETEEEAKNQIKEWSYRAPSGPRTPSALDAALDLLRNLK